MSSAMLHPRVWNPSGARRAMLLHGLAADGATTFRIAAHLAARGFRVSAPDLRGHGLSPPTEDYSLGAYVADVAAIATDLDLLVGHSWGGTIAAELLARAGTARAGVLLDPVLRLDGDAADRLADDLAAQVAPDVPLAEFAAAHPAWDAEDTFRARRAAQLTSPDVMRATIARSRPVDLRDRVGAWPVPVEVVLADPAHGALCTAADLGLAGERVRVTTATAAGHCVQREALPAVLAAVDRAVAAVDG